MTAQAHPLDLLHKRACAMAARVDRGEIPFLDAINFLWSASEFSGLVDQFGPD